MNVKHYEPSLFFGPMSQGGILYNGKFDVIFFAWEADPSGDTSSQYECSQKPPNGQDISRYCSPIADQAFETYKRTFDPILKQRASDVFQTQIAKDVPVVVLDVRENIFAHNLDLKNFHPNSATPFDDMLDVDI